MKKPKNRPIQKKKGNLAIIPNNKVAGTEIINSVSSNRIKIIAALFVTCFLAAAGYSKYAKSITGGLYWKPTSLSVEYGDVILR